MLAPPTRPPLDPAQAAEMLACAPRLCAFAISLCGCPDRAGDLVQEALLRGVASISSFQPGTSMQAWLFTILRNRFYSEHRWRRRECPLEVVGPGGKVRLVREPAAGGEDAAAAGLDWQKVEWCLRLLPRDQREALELVGVSGYSYEAVADVLGCAVGTIKSRVNRGRAALERLMAGYRVVVEAEDADMAEALARLEQAGALDDFVGEEY